VRDHLRRWRGYRLDDVESLAVWRDIEAAHRDAREREFASVKLEEHPRLADARRRERLKIHCHHATLALRVGSTHVKQFPSTWMPRHVFATIRRN
jgi:hypothetical protein